MSDSGIEILLSSDDDHEKLTAEIFYGKFIALLNQDDGVNNLKIEFPGRDVEEDLVSRKIDLASFLKGLEFAKQKIGV